MTPEEVCDREEIRHLMARYNIAGDRADLAGLAATFAEDGILVFNNKANAGRAEIVARLSSGSRSPGLEVSRHHLSTSLVTVDGDQATGRTYFAVYTNAGPDHHGVYIDRFARIDGAWAIQHREVRIDWQSERSVNAPQHVRGKPPIA